MLLLFSNSRTLLSKYYHNNHLILKFKTSHTHLPFCFWKTVIILPHSKLSFWEAALKKRSRGGRDRLLWRQPDGGDYEICLSVLIGWLAGWLDLQVLIDWSDGVSPRWGDSGIWGGGGSSVGKPVTPELILIRSERPATAEWSQRLKWKTGEITDQINHNVSLQL